MDYAPSEGVEGLAVLGVVLVEKVAEGTFADLNIDLLEIGRLPRPPPKQLPLIHHIIDPLLEQIFRLHRVILTTRLCVIHTLVLLFNVFCLNNVRLRIRIPD